MFAALIIICYYFSLAIMRGTPPWPFPLTEDTGGELGLGPAPPHRQNLPAAETTAKELTSSGRKSEAEHANGTMSAGDQIREDVSS